MPPGTGEGGGQGRGGGGGVEGARGELRISWRGGLGVGDRLAGGGEGPGS